MLKIKEIAVFGILGGLLYAQKALLAAIPNVHLGAVMIAAMTLVYRRKALYPIAVYVLLEGLFGGFTIWWIPYLYVWVILWGAVMLLPSGWESRRYGFLVYMLVCGMHGLLFGTLCAPPQAIGMGLDFRGLTDWILAGLPFDAIHGLSNFCLAILVLPLTRLLRKLQKTVL